MPDSAMNDAATKTALPQPPLDRTASPDSDHDHDLDNCRFGCSPDPIRRSLRGGADTLPKVAEAVTRTVTAAARPRPKPQILLGTTPAWRQDCLKRTAHIPAGYTYLGQLMGHDIGSSVPQSSVPHSKGADALMGPKRYNLIDNPLTLETVYGPGPSMLSHLYEPETMLFRLTPGARLARVFTGLMGSDHYAIRALYDERNRDTLMLHELAVAWMQFHNLCARTLLDRGTRPFTAYAKSRLHVVHVWHEIIRKDILPRFLHPEFIAPNPLPEAWQLPETTLLHGLFRAFHAMPLAAYDLGASGLHNLQGLMKSGFDHSLAEAEWRIDWPLFFGDKPGGPMTGLSASVAPELRAPVTAAAVTVMDNESTRDADPLRAGSPEMRAALALLPAPWPEKLAPARLAADFNAAYDKSPVDITERDLEDGPLYQMIMVEAQLYGRKGGLGPFGSALLCGSINGSIDRIEPRPAPVEGLTRFQPQTMLELINLVRG